MATSKRFGLYPATLTHGGGTINLQQLEGVEISPNTSRSEIIPGGAVDRAHVGIASAAPVVTLRTRDLSTFFAGVSGTTGLALVSSSTLRFQERANAGTFETGATHETYTIASGFIAPQQLTASQDDEAGALLSAQLTALWDGTNDPIARSTGVDFTAAPAPAFTSRYFLGPVYHNGSQLEGVTRVTIDFGLQFVARIFDGDPYPRLGSIVTRLPRFTFTMAKMDAIAALGLFGRSITNSFACYFWKGVADGTRVAVASTVHGKISATAGHWGDETIQVSGTDDAMVDIIVMPTSTLTISTASAIP